MRFFYTLAIIACFSLLSTSCKKDVTEIIKEITKTDTLLVAAKDTSFSTSNLAAWNYVSLVSSSVTVLPSGTSTYSTTTEGIKIVSPGYRLAARLQTKTEFRINGKILYYKWKLVGNSQFAAVALQLKYDPLTTDNIPAIQSVDYQAFCVGNPFTGCTFVQENTWYYTRIVPVPGTDNYVATTATGNYSNSGGTNISTVTFPIYTKAGYPAIRITDNYSTSAYAVLGECKIASN